MFKTKNVMKQSQKMRGQTVRTSKNLRHNFYVNRTVAQFPPSSGNYNVQESTLFDTSSLSVKFCLGLEMQRW